MKFSLPSFRAALFVGAAVLAASGVAAASLLPSNVHVDIGRTFHVPDDLSTHPASGFAVGKISDLSVDHIDPRQWNYGGNGDANANDVALFRLLVTAGGHDGESPEMAALAILLLFIGGIAYAQRRARSVQERPKRRPLFPA